MLGLEPLVVGVRHNADGQDVQVPLPNPGHGPVTDVVHAAVQVRHLAHARHHLSFGRVVEAGLGRIRIVPEYRVVLVVDTVSGWRWRAKRNGYIQSKWQSLGNRLNRQPLRGTRVCGKEKRKQGKDLRFTAHRHGTTDGDMYR